MMKTQETRAPKTAPPALSRRAVAAGFCLLTLAPAFVAGAASAGEAPVIAADEAAKQAAAGELLVIDVRSPREWHQTGVPKGSRQVTIHNPGGLAAFVEAVKATVGGDLDKPVAMICATGNRSTIASQALGEAGFTHVLNIREGMFGSTYGKGWLERGLPLETCASC